MFEKSELLEMLDAYDDLKHQIIKATKGYWIAVGRHVENTESDLPDVVCNDGDRLSGNDSYEQQCADAEYIAMVQPKFIQEMLEEREQLILSLLDLTEYDAQEDLFVDEIVVKHLRDGKK